MHLKMSSAKWRPFCPGGWDLLMICVKELGLQSLTRWFVACPPQAFIWIDAVIQSQKNKTRWNLNANMNILSLENSFELLSEKKSITFIKL